MKYTLRAFLVIVVIAGAIQGSQYLFNHVNPWLGIAAMLLGFAIVIGIVIDAVKKYYSSNKKVK